MSEADTFSADAKAKLKSVINDGMGITQEIESLREGLRDTVKAVAKELNMKPAAINKAIKIAHKHDLDEQLSDFETVETILEIAQKGR